MTTVAERKAVEEQDRLEPGKGIASVMVRTIGTARRKSGEDFETMLNVTCEVVDATSEQFALLHSASKIDQSLYVGSVADVATVATVHSKHKDMKCVLVFHRPSKGNLERMFDALEWENQLELFQAQLRMPTDGDDPVPFDGDEAGGEGEE